MSQTLPTALSQWRKDGQLIVEWITKAIYKYKGVTGDTDSTKVTHNSVPLSVVKVN